MDTNELFTCSPIENDLFVAVDRVAVLFAFIFLSQLGVVLSLWSHRSFPML